MSEATKLCPDCAIEMKQDPKYEFWKCPECKGEWWPDDEEYRKKRDKIESEKNRKHLLWAIGKRGTEEMLSMSLGGRVKGGGSKSSGRKKKKKVVRKLPWMVE